MSKNINFFLIPLFLSMGFWWMINFSQNNLENFFYAQISEPIGQIIEVKLPQKPLLELKAKSAISIKISKSDKEKTLFRKNTEEVLPLASLTKLITALVVLEDPNYDLKRLVVVSKAASNQENVPNYGNLKIGERFTVEKLLELMLSYSSNDAAYALAEVIGVDNFVDKMNFKTRELMLAQTQFLNPTGLDPENLFYGQDTKSYFNYSTADDLIILAKYIFFNHPLILEIASKKKTYQVKNGVSDLIFPENQVMLGGKTGYTDEAGGCLFFIFQNEQGTVFINVILGSPSSESRTQDAQKLINWINSF
ncbi:MAG: D-alanyl-D-alanine carboxypeptidase [Candidatus Nealsonbacteria bacterium]|nr:D-alanyl-D-alanine carboxypeptidase [Candidatus Nealsonbacteria bacterium]